jgi:hypothetical protein
VTHTRSLLTHTRSLLTHTRSLMTHTCHEREEDLVRDQTHVLARVKGVLVSGAFRDASVIEGSNLLAVLEIVPEISVEILALLQQGETRKVWRTLNPVLVS